VEQWWFERCCAHADAWEAERDALEAALYFLLCFHGFQPIEEWAIHAVLDHDNKRASIYEARRKMEEKP
jgi:hypothetical protein